LNSGGIKESEEDLITELVKAGMLHSATTGAMSSSSSSGAAPVALVSPLQSAKEYVNEETQEIREN